MSTVTCATGPSLLAAIEAEGFAFVYGAPMREILAPFGSLADWQRFADSWNHLELDPYMADGGRYRRRRHAVFASDSSAAVARKPHEPHYQSVDYNPLNGGIARWFEPIALEVGNGPTMRTILQFCRSFFGGMAPDVPSWHIEVHQFRIEARQGEAGLPTPEGLHRDGVDYVLVLLVRRQNIASGTTMIYGKAGERLGSFTLVEPFDAAFVDDGRVFHGVTPVEALEPGSPAHRDVLVVTFAARPTTTRSSDASAG
jgi:hypothetical protein